MIKEAKKEATRGRSNHKVSADLARRTSAAGAQQEEIVQTSFRLPRSRWQRLHEVAIGDRVSVQALIIGALEAEFQKRGRKF